MVHLTGEEDFVAQLPWRKATHKPTEDEFVIMTDDFSAESIYGTLSGRAGDVLMRGEDKKLYVILVDALTKRYDITPTTPTK